MVLQSHYEKGLDDLTLLNKIHDFEKSKNSKLFSQLLQKNKKKNKTRKKIKRKRIKKINL